MAGEGKPYLVPSACWDEVAELSDSGRQEGNNYTDATSEDSNSDSSDSYQALTLLRNETICE